MDNTLRENALLGTQLKDGKPKKHKKDVLISLVGTHNGISSSVDLTEVDLSKSVITIGAPGCGKTNILLEAAAQIKKRLTQDDVLLIFDTKGDYSRNLYRNGDCIIGGSSQARDNIWNIFCEILADGCDDPLIVENSFELSNMLFAEKIEKADGGNSYFPQAARDTTAGSLISFVRQGLEDRQYFREHLFNNKFKEFFDTAKTVAPIIDHLEQYPDIRSLAWHVKGDSGINTQTQGVLAELNGLMHSVFVSEFAKEGTFSMRQFIRKRGGKTAFLLYDLKRGTVLAPIYRIIIDLAIKEALSSSSSKGSIYIIADELKLAPHLQYLETGITFGRSKGLKILAGMQSITQLKSIYPKAVAENIVGNFGTTISFFSNDPETRSYISDKFGKNYVSMAFEDQKGKGQEKQRSGYSVEDWDQYNLGLGDAVVGIGNNPPFKFHFNRYSYRF